MKASVILSIFLSVCSAYVLQKRSLLGEHAHHHQHHPLPHRGHLRRQLLNQSSFRHHDTIQETRHGRDGALGETDHHGNHNDHGNTDVRSAPAGYLPPSDDYEDDLTSYTVNNDVASYGDQSQNNADVNENDFTGDGEDDLQNYTANDDVANYGNQSQNSAEGDEYDYSGDGEGNLNSYTANDAVANYGDQSQYNTDNELTYSGDAGKDSQDSQDIQGQYGVDSLGQYDEENLGHYEKEDQEQQYRYEKKQGNGKDNLEQYGEEYDIQDENEEEPLEVGSASPEYDPIKDVNDFYSKPVDDLDEAPLEKSIIEKTIGDNGIFATDSNKVSDSYGVPTNDSNDLGVEESYIAPDKGDINVADDTYSAPSKLVDSEQADDLYGAPRDDDIVETTDSVGDTESTEITKETADDSYSAPSDDLNDEAYIAPVMNDANSPDDTYGAPSEAVDNKSTDDIINLSEETYLIPPPATDDEDANIAQSDYAAPSNPLDNEYLSPSNSPTSDYSVLGSNDSQVGSVISDSGSSVRQTCPGGSIEHCVTVCPGVTARVYGACVQGCANRCA